MVARTRFSAWSETMLASEPKAFPRDLEAAGHGGVSAIGQSEEESRIGWGEAPEPDDDERLRRERPLFEPLLTSLDASVPMPSARQSTQAR